MPAKKTTKRRKVTKKTPDPAMNLYRNIAMGFVLVTLFALIVVVYSSIVQATIRIVPVQKQVSESSLIDVGPSGSGAHVLSGSILTREVEISDTFSVRADASNKTPVEGRASGVMKITNNRSTSQQLVATTRFLSEGGILFRLDEGVVVPANSSIEARVTADEAGRSGDVGPGRFAIPGLSESLQEIVYGETSAAMQGGERFVQTLSQQDVDLAIGILSEDALESVRAQMQADVRVFSDVVFTTETLSTEGDTELGTETDRFGVTVRVNVVGVFYDLNEIIAQAEEDLFAGLSLGVEPVAVNRDAVEVSVERYDLETGVSTLRVDLSGSVVPSAANDALARGVFAGMTEDQVRRYFIDNEIAKDVRVDMQPGWTKRIPRSQNKIRLVIEEE